MLPIKYCLQQFYRLSLIVIISIAFALPIFAQTGVPAGSMSQCDTQMQTILTNYQIPGATFALTKDGKLIYMRAFGTANQTGTEVTQPYHMFRIASISKTITSIAIMKLIENGQLSLSDKPFGPGGILNADPYFANANVTDPRVYNITIQNLLEHSAGWNRDLPMPPGPVSPYPWGYGHSDPTGFPLHVTQTLGEANPATRRAMIKFSIQKGLDFAPGTAYNYSNTGFLVLGEVIEKKTGLTYENYVKQNIFAPLGIYDIRLGKSLLADKQEREGEYINTFTTLSAYGTGQFVPSQYGGFSLGAMDASGAWIATSRDLVRLLTGVDGFPSRPDILSPTSIQTMTTPSANNINYAKGWQIYPSSNNWGHGGALGGTYSFMVRTNDQFNWAVIFNKLPGVAGFGTAVSNLGRNCINATTTFPTHDLFDVPTQNASAMNFSNITSNSMTVNWTNGNGDGRVLIRRAGGAPNKFPLDGTEYAVSPEVDLGDGNRVVYSGTGNNTTVSNLNSNTNYQFRLYEYKKNVNTGDYALYQLANAASGSQNTLGTTSQTTRFDFDGDGKADVSVFRPSNGAWYLNQSANGFTGVSFGQNGDKIVPADYDGDGKTDVAVFRNGSLYVNRSQLGFTGIAFGEATDIPVAEDWDGDGKADIGVYRSGTTANTQGYFYYRPSSQPNVNFVPYPWGSLGDKPVVADFDGDGKADPAVFRPSNGAWYIQRSREGFYAIQFGATEDKPVVGDYDGDGKADQAVFRPSNGVWYIWGSRNGFSATQFGISTDKPVPADYDGDGKTDYAVYRDGSWFILNSTSGFAALGFGNATDKPIANSFVP